MAVSKVFSVFMVALLLGSAVAQSPSPAPIVVAPRSGPLAPSPLSMSPSHSPSGSPTPAPTKPSASPPSASPSPSPVAILSPPSPPSASPSPSVSMPPSSDGAPAPSQNGAALNRVGLAAAAAGLFAVALMS